MAMTTSKDFGSGQGDKNFGRFQTNKAEDLDENAVHGLEQLDRTRTDAEPAEGFGIPGGLAKDHDEREAERLELVENTIAGEYIDPPANFNPRDPNDDAPDDFDKYGSMNPPRHDRWADENSPYPTPDRVVPSTPTNANPSFADYQVPTQDRPGRADGKDAAETAISLGEEVAEGDEPIKPTVKFEFPDGPVAGEGSFVVREPTEEATGVTSPTGHPHNDPREARGENMDSYEEAKVAAAEHGGTVKDYGTEDNPIPAIPVAGTGSEPAGVPVPEENAEAGAVPTGDAPASTGEPNLSGTGELTYTGPANTGSTATAGGEATGDGTVTGTTEEHSEDEEEAPPPKSATKGDWIEYVLRNYETDIESLNSMTKDEIIGTYGS